LIHAVAPSALASPSGALTAVAIDEGFAYVDDPSVGIYANDWIRVDASEWPLAGGYRGHGWHTTGFAPFTAYDAPALSMLVPADPAEIPPAGTVSVWLLSPPVQFGPGFSLFFMARSFRGAADWTGVDRLQVRLCTGGDCGHPGLSAEDPGDFAQLLLDINADEEESGFPNVWTPYTVDTADGVPVTGIGRIAFRYYVHQDAGSNAAGLLGLDRVVVAGESAHDDGISLALHASLHDPEQPACTGSDTIAATRGDTIDLCYEVANTSGETLRYHSLRDDAVGPLLTSEEQDLEPGSMRAFHRQMTVTGNKAISATATSIAEPRDYAIDPNQPDQYLDIHASAPVVTPGNIMDMPFAFEFYGRPVSRFCVREDATLAIVNADHCPSQTVGAVPTSDGEWVSNSPFAAVYAERFWPNIGHVYMTTAGTAPSRQLVIQWYQKVPLTVPPASIDPAMGLDAELILHEGSNQIEFLYRNTRFGGPPGNDDGGNASIGLQKDLRGVRFGYHEPVLASVRRIVFSPTRPASRVDTQTATINALVPALAVSMASVDASAPSHGVATRTLDVANTGTGRLDWRAEFASTQTRTPSTEPERPFYTFDLWNTNMGVGYGPLIRFSPEHTNFEFPDGAVVLAVLTNRSVYAAAFVDDDFATLYAIDSDTRELMRWTGVDQPGGVATYAIVGTVPLLMDPITGIRQDPTTGVTYLTTSNGTTSSLWHIDLGTASVDPVGEIAGGVAVDDIAFDTSGQLYGIDEEADALLSIDKTTAIAGAVGSLGIDAAHGSALDFDASTATMYLITFDQSGSSLYNQLFTVDRTSGAASALSDVVGADSALPIALWETLAIARRSGACTVSDAVPWLRLSTNEGPIPPGTAPAGITLTFDGTSLPDGLYQANLCLYSNDPMRSRIPVPLSFALGADAIFAGSFER
jgi:hypothetical protein